MYNKKNKNRINLIRVPNLTKPGMKFDQNIHRNPVFFSKIANTFKMLEDSQPVPVQSSQTQNYRYKKSNEKLIKLSQPRNFSSDNFDKKQKKKDRKMDKLPKLHSTYELGSGQIKGSKLVPIPVEEILRQRQLEKEKPIKQCFAETLSDPESDQEEQKQKQRYKPEGKDKDFSLWAQMIIKNQPNNYEEYESRIMEKTRKYMRKQYKINHKSLWK